MLKEQSMVWGYMGGIIIHPMKKLNLALKTKNGEYLYSCNNRVNLVC
ncbi:hypothetical protein PALI_a2629 [Pseudoalteromonas aliena SW19]|uniref:Uncharacterized protein n=1 Tax=Pseudoalteromonas aliena SW19 TaxID=1314866 RepID=A0ABR9E1Y9_9GAMM|nr:hypothetical protein [Pseudoalteromonas aliena SW19]